MEIKMQKRSMSWSADCVGVRRTEVQTRKETELSLNKGELFIMADET